MFREERERKIKREKDRAGMRERLGKRERRGRRRGRERERRAVGALSPELHSGRVAGDDQGERENEGDEVALP